MGVTESPSDRAARRVVCERCERPAQVCYCDALATIETRSRIVILQHPRERGMPIGTARMAHLCLPQSSLHVGIQWDGGDLLRGACADPERPPILLYPGPDARDILEDPPETPVTLIVLDGTWSQARGVVRRNPELAALPRYAFRPPAPSIYRIRREPRDDYVSTIEALAHVLGALEGDAERFRALLRPMNAMIEAHLETYVDGRQPRWVHSKVRLSPYERLPLEIRERYEDIVLVYGEANGWPHGTPQRDLGDELVHWIAHRPSTGETFSSVIAPRLPLAPEVPGHVGLSAEQLLAGGSVAEMLDGFSAFLRPTDVLASWGYHGLRLFQKCGGRLTGACVDLKKAARVLSRAKTGRLDRYAAELEVPPGLGLPPGRAGRRLGLLVAMVASWRALPPPSGPCSQK